jgi:rhodanese-related sulfurtransferase
MAQAMVQLMPGKEKGSVTVESFEKVWKQNPGSVMLVDVRDPKEVASGMIKGSVNIPMNELEKEDRHAADRQAGGFRLRHGRALGRSLRHRETAGRKGTGLLPRRRRQIQRRRYIQHEAEIVVSTLCKRAALGRPPVCSNYRRRT